MIGDWDDWTQYKGRANSSQEFEDLVTVVDILIRNNGWDLINGRSISVARLIMAQLAHVHHLRPDDRR